MKDNKKPAPDLAKATSEKLKLEIKKYIKVPHDIESYGSINYFFDEVCRDIIQSLLASHPDNKLKEFARWVLNEGYGMGRYTMSQKAKEFGITDILEEK